MKTNKILLSIVGIIAVILLVIISCEKEPEPPSGKSSFKTGTAPTVSVQAAQSLTFTGAEVNVQVTSTGNRVIKRLCLCYSTVKTSPDTLDQVVELGEVASTGTFKATLQNLNHNTNYYFRAYSRNMIGKSYSNALNLTTPKDTRLPEVTTGSASSITLNTATLSGTITSFGQSSTATQHGHVWAKHNNPTLSDNKTQLGSTSSSTITSNPTGLDESTTYYFRAYATNNIGTSYGGVQNFTTYGVPTVTTNDVTSITSTTATSGGGVTATGGSSVTGRGVCWSTNQNPTISDSKTTNGTGIGNFTSSITGLTHGTTYYLRAYATNAFGTSYGVQKTFTTVTLYAPTLTTTDVTNITYNAATSGGNITADGGSAITVRGVCWSTNQNPTTSDSKTTNGSGTGIYTSSLTNLTHGTTYYIRAFATNTINTGYGEQKTFTTVTLYPPSITTTDVSGITYNSASSGGNITADGGSPVTARGVCWSTNQNPTVNDNKTTNGTGTGSFSSSVTDLSQGVTYYLRAFATTSYGTIYGEQKTFTTLVLTAPTVTTAEVTTILYTSAVCGGTVTSDGNGTVTARGVCWSTTQNPTIANSYTSSGTGTGAFTSNLSNLTNGTTYYVRAYVTTAYGTSYGDGKVFSTLTYSVPVLSTSNITNITYNSATSGGSIISNGGYTITAKGICISTNPNPSLNDNFTTNGTGSNNFVSNISNLVQLTTYYIRSYATNGIGTGYGNELSFTTEKYPWVEMAVFGGTPRTGSVGFSIETKGYIGIGQDNSGLVKDFWEYNPSTNSWSQKANFGGTARRDAVGFSVGTKGYIGTGYDGSSRKKDFWEYNPSTNTWTQKADFPGIGRGYAVGFSIGSKGYLGTGSDNNMNLYRDFWEYDPTTNIWTQKANFGGTARMSSSGFSINNKGYIGCGLEYISGSLNSTKDFWEYNPISNSWIRKTDFGGNNRSSATCFSIGLYGYIGCGAQGGDPTYKDFWKYDQILDTWTKMADFGSIRRNCIGFAINTKGYIGVGDNYLIYYNDFWSFEP
ncbi:MAG: hypothetical protein AB9846_09510 [Tenuifilaceae bacterium]